MASTIIVTITKKSEINADIIKDWCDFACRIDGEEKAALFAEVSDRSDLFSSEKFEDLRHLIEQITEDDEGAELDTDFEVCE